MLWFLFVVIPGLSNFFCALTFFLFSFMIISLIICSIVDDDTYNTERNKINKDKIKSVFLFSKKSAIFGFISLFFACILPSQSDITKISGAYVVTNIEGIEKLPPNLVKVANDYLERMVMDND